MLEQIVRPRVILLTCTCVAIHPERVEPASPIDLTTCRTEALQARRFCASSLDTFTQSFLHRAWPKTRVIRQNPAESVTSDTGVIAPTRERVTHLKKLHTINQASKTGHSQHTPERALELTVRSAECESVPTTGMFTRTLRLTTKRHL